MPIRNWFRIRRVLKSRWMRPFRGVWGLLGYSKLSITALSMLLLSCSKVVVDALVGLCSPRFTDTTAHDKNNPLAPLCLSKSRNRSYPKLLCHFASLPGTSRANQDLCRHVLISSPLVGTQKTLRSEIWNLSLVGWWKPPNDHLSSRIWTYLSWPVGIIGAGHLQDTASLLGPTQWGASKLFESHLFPVSKVVPWMTAVWVAILQAWTILNRICAWLSHKDKRHQVPS